eukprot:CAMPEP_0171104786 /NCGR_PEP_ID=MMETSP0766_2-20121228/61331_1 /TAXON_ID=439317 /ORGANISM="Gambierdiscus australes, Strain CAWD 149" /LENGTH=39 /DNA_ID= /DNA_START= /DNA_END= /DNA_ORIENTATION=
MELDFSCLMNLGRLSACFGFEDLSSSVAEAGAAASGAGA